MVGFLSAFACAALSAQTWVFDSAFAPLISNEWTALPSVTLVAAGSNQFYVHSESSNITHVNGVAVGGLARVNLAGELDPTFNAETEGEMVRAVAPLPDGRALVMLGGSDIYFATSSGPYRAALDDSAIVAPPLTTPPAFQSRRLFRLTTSGRKDPSFSPISVGVSSAQLTPLADGRVFVWGNGIIRLNPDGTPDRTFVSAVSVPRIWAAAPADDGSIVVYGGDEGIAGRSKEVFVRLQPNGAIDPHFAPRTIAKPIAVQPDGSVLTLSSDLVRLRPDGEVDSSYVIKIPNRDGYITRVIPLSDGRVVLEAPIKVFGSDGSSWRMGGVFVVGANGELARDFGTAAGAAEGQQLLGVIGGNRVVVLQGSRAVTLNYYRASFDPAAPTEIGPGVLPLRGMPILHEPCIAVSTPDHARLANLTTTVTRRYAGTVTKLHADATGRVIAAGDFSYVNERPQKGLARFLANGELDPSFTPPGGELAFAARDGTLIVRRIAVGPLQSDGLHHYGFEFVRLRSDGTIDPNFVFPASLDAGTTNFLALAADGRFLVAGFEPNNSRPENLRLIWLAADGHRLAALPTKFPVFVQPIRQPFEPELGLYSPGVVVTIPVQFSLFGSELSNGFYTGRVLPGDSVLVAGNFARVDALERPGIVRLRADGTVDPEFASNVPPIEYVTTATLLPDGGAIVFGSSIQSGKWQSRVMRLRADGSPDPVFDPPADTLTDGAALLSDGSFFSAGRRFFSDGSPDLNLDLALGNAFTSAANCGVLDASGGLWLGGTLQQTDRRGSRALARFAPVESIRITMQPQSLSMTAGRDAVFQVAVGTREPASYQWLHDGIAVAGASNALLKVPAIRDADQGSYRAVVTVGARAFLSDVANLTVAANTSRIVNFSARSRIRANAAQTVGVVLAPGSTPRTVLVRAVGRGIPALGAEALPVPILALYRQGEFVAQDRGGAISASNLALASSLGAFPIAGTASPDGTIVGSALARSFEGGAFTAVTTSGDGGNGVSLFEYYDPDDGSTPAALRNFSVSAPTGPGADVLTVGFVISGNGPLRVLVRGLGPALAQFGISGAIADPRLAIFVSGWNLPLRANDARSNDAPLAEVARTAGAFALRPGSADAAVVASLEPGAYMVQLSSATAATGTAMIETYVIGY